MDYYEFRAGLWDKFQNDCRACRTRRRYVNTYYFAAVANVFLVGAAQIWGIIPSTALRWTISLANLLVITLAFYFAVHKLPRSERTLQCHVGEIYMVEIDGGGIIFAPCSERLHLSSGCLVHGPIKRHLVVKFDFDYHAAGQKLRAKLKAFIEITPSKFTERGKDALGCCFLTQNVEEELSKALTEWLQEAVAIDDTTGNLKLGRNELQNNPFGWTIYTVATQDVYVLSDSILIIQ